MYYRLPGGGYDVFPSPPSPCLPGPWAQLACPEVIEYSATGLHSDMFDCPKASVKPYYLYCLLYTKTSCFMRCTISFFWVGKAWHVRTANNNTSTRVEALDECMPRMYVLTSLGDSKDSHKLMRNRLSASFCQVSRCNTRGWDCYSLVCPFRCSLTLWQGDNSSSRHEFE